jgi:transposase
LFEAYLLALAKAMPIANAAERLGEHDTRLWRIVEHYVWRAVEALDLREVRRIAADETSARRGHDYISLFIDMARRKVVYVSEGKDAATVKEFAEFLEAHGGDRRAVTDASIDMGAAFEAGIKQNFPNAEITFDKFHVIKLANEAVDEVRRQEVKNRFQIKGRRYIFLKNVDRLTTEEKQALSELEAQNLDTVQAMQIRMNLQQLFTMDEKTARRYLDRWHAWVKVCDLAPMKRLAKTIIAKSKGILRSISTGLSNGVLEAINGNVQAAKRKAKGYRSKRNLKAIVYLIAGDVLAKSPT